MRQLLRSPDIAHLLCVALGKDDVDLFERSLCCLRVEEVNDRDEASVCCRKEEVGSPANVGDHDRRNHDNDKVEQPVDTGGDSVGFGSGLDGVDFGRVEPGQGEPGGAEEGNVGKQAHSSAASSHFLAVNEAGERDDHGKGLSQTADEEHLSPADALDDEPGSGGEDGINDHVDTAQEE